jgi:hypothetical protein
MSHRSAGTMQPGPWQVPYKNLNATFRTSGANLPMYSWARTSSLIGSMRMRCQNVLPVPVVSAIH